MMSGPKTRNKGKQLIQTKLSFTSTSNQTAIEKDLDTDRTESNTSSKGTKRAIETSQSDLSDDMDPAMRSKVLAAAEKRKKLSEEQRENSTESPYFAETKSNENSSKAGEEDKALPSTSAGNGEQAGDTLQYDMSDSQELFDSEPVADSQNSTGSEAEDLDLCKKPSTWDANRPWKGIPLDKLKTAPSCLPANLKLDPNISHDVCIRVPFHYQKTALPVPYPHSYQDEWDDKHVRMPCSNKNQYPVGNENNSVKLQRRWDLVIKALKSPIRDSEALERAILSYNQRFDGKWHFTCLHHYFIEHVNAADRKQFFDVLLPLMVRLALKLPYLCTKPIPLLKKGKAHKVTLSQQQIACLLANAFFCTYPRRNSRARTAEYAAYPEINFKSLFQGPPISRKMEKLTCIIHYFKRVCYDMPGGLVTFSRKVLQSPYDWRNCLHTLRGLHVSSSGTIEDNGIGMLQVDFANKFLGGGVLNRGCVQEEIRFMICPEMIISCLFTEVLGEMECLVMTGCEQFSEYEGYADSFKWKGDFQDQTGRDSMGRLCCEVVAIDALVFHGSFGRQFKAHSVIRELNKAYCGFMSSLNEDHRAAVCTGNWGCGAFGGDKHLKSLIQLMAASAAKRDLCYFTFDDENLTASLHKVHQLLCTEEKTITEILRLTEGYNKEVVGQSNTCPSVSLFDYISLKLEGSVDSQDFNLSPMGGVDFDENSNEAQELRQTNSTAADRSPDYKANTP